MSLHRNRSLKARSKQTQTELLVQMDDNSKIIVANFPLNYRQRRRRSSQAVSANNEARELNYITPTIVLPPAEKASTPKSSCSEDDDSLDGEDITEEDMTWLTQITEQPVVTPLCDAMHSDSELDDSNDNLLLPYSTMDMSISPLPPTPSMKLNDETNKRIKKSNDVSTQSEDHYMSNDDLLKECHLSPVVPDEDNDKVEESILISSHQLSDDPDNVVVTTDSAKLLLEKATGKVLW